MEQHGDCVLVFPYQGDSDGHAFVFRLSSHWNEISFHIGEGCDGEVNKLSADGLYLEDQLKLICQFCKNPILKHLSIVLAWPLDEWAPPSKMGEEDRLRLLWETLMRELRGTTSLEYIEFRNFLHFQDFVNFWGDTEIFWKTTAKMISINSSLLGLKLRVFIMVEKDFALLMKAASTNKTLQLLHVDYIAGEEAFQGLKVLMASLTPDSTGYQSNTMLQALYLTYRELQPSKRLSDKTRKSLIETFVNMIEMNTTLTTIQIPGFVVQAEDVVKILNALEVNQSISNIFLSNGRSDHSGEFSKQEVFSGLLKLIKFRNDHGNGLNMVDVQGTSLEKSEFNVQIQGALKKKYCIDGSNIAIYIRPMSCRVFLCGFPEAGKTTLRKKIKYILHEKSKWFHPHYSFSKRVDFPSTRVLKRTIGVEVVATRIGDVELSLWDMGGQDEYHAYHDLVISNLNDNGSASLFILVCSMATIESGTKCAKAKSSKAIELELQYWLRFLSSNTRTSRNFKLHVFVVFTHMDVLPRSMNVERHIEDMVTSLKLQFGDFFHFSSIEHFVNGNSTQMVEPLVESLAKEVEVALTKVPNIFAACLEMRDEITKWKKDHPYQTIIKWKNFMDMCWELPWLKKAISYLDANLVEDICKSIASSLNEGGYIIYLEGVDVIVMDPNWFGTRIIGSIFSIDHKCFNPHTGELITNEKGYIEREKLVSVLENSFKDKKSASKYGVNLTPHVDVDDLICVMKAMNVCFEEQSASNNEKHKRSIFIPATLRDEGGLAHQGRRKLDWNDIGSSTTQTICYIGRRLQCEDTERTFLTPVFFPRLQVVLERKFGSKSTFRLEKNMVAFTEDGMQVLVEHSGDFTSGNLVNGFIDVMVQSLKTFEVTLEFAKQEVMRPIQILCTSPMFGCQGGTLLQSILRPECVEHLWLCNDRRDQAINERELIENVLSKEDFETYIHHWPDHHGDEARKLLGDVVWNEEIVNKRIANMAELTIVLMQEQAQDMGSNKMEEIELKEDSQVTSLERLYKKLSKDLGKVGDSIVERVNKHMDETICGMRHEVLEEVSKSVNRLMDHSMQLLQRQVPCYVYVTTKDLGTCEWLISSLVPGLKSVKLHLMCEHKGHIHTIDGQNGVALHLESKTLQGLRPYVIWGLRIITMLMKVSANVGAGLGSMVPDLEKSLLKGVASTIPSVASDIFGREGTPIEQVNLMKLKNYFSNSEKKVAEQWLVKFLVGIDLEREFGLRRVRYMDGSNDLAWVCQRHIDEGHRKRILELYPIQVVK